MKLSYDMLYNLRETELERIHKEFKASAEAREEGKSEFILKVTQKIGPIFSGC